MPMAKGKTRRQKFGYSVKWEHLNRNCFHIRHAWDHGKSVQQNLAEMGLAMDPNKEEVDMEERPKMLVQKPYVLSDLEAEASLPGKKGSTAMARVEKNYYRDTPKQIRNKINVYKHFYPAEWQIFIDSLQNKMEVE
ncbi:unnamed protein product [Nyctereutes procyonoides]|uniref:Nucleolar protein 16 n=1 Tax=Nyctereutes procyonoides TaxID=34880 RepID=A0A811Z2J8_NYCPR|nr:unnamed protein product [Nyctereutes procyonoides]